MATGGITIRKALEIAAEQKPGVSADEIVSALDAVGFTCDQEDVRDGFQQLQSWAMMMPPLRLTPDQRQVVQEAQQSVLPGAVCHVEDADGFSPAQHHVLSIPKCILLFCLVRGSCRPRAC
jgi:hypothetical protein